MDRSCISMHGVTVHAGEAFRTTNVYNKFTVSLVLWEYSCPEFPGSPDRADGLVHRGTTPVRRSMTQMKEQITMTSF